jgi:hypothetical protein
MIMNLNDIEHQIALARTELRREPQFVIVPSNFVELLIGNWVGGQLGRVSNVPIITSDETEKILIAYEM